MRVYVRLCKLTLSWITWSFLDELRILFTCSHADRAFRRAGAVSAWHDDDVECDAGNGRFAVEDHHGRTGRQSLERVADRHSGHGNCAILVGDLGDSNRLRIGGGSHARAGPRGHHGCCGRLHRHSADHRFRHQQPCVSAGCDRFRAIVVEGQADTKPCRHRDPGPRGAVHRFVDDVRFHGPAAHVSAFWT